MFAHGKPKYSLKLLVEVDVMPDGSVMWQVGDRDRRKGSRTDKFAESSYGIEFKPNWWHHLPSYQPQVPDFIGSILAHLVYLELATNLKRLFGKQ